MSPASNPPGPPALHLERCNPYGHTTGRGGDRGPRHLLGGLYGPEYEGAKKWVCENLADGYWVMTCACGHKGQRMPLCYPHVAMISKRQSQICPPCVMPPAARALYEDITRAQAHVVALHLAEAPGEQIRAGVSIAEGLALEMTLMYEQGFIHRCPLTLTEVS